MPHHPTLDLLATRRSAALSTLAAPGPNEADLQTILTLAARVPDHAKLVPWRFIVIAGAAKEKLRESISIAFASSNPGSSPAQLAESGAKLGNSPLTIAVVISPKIHAKVPEIEQTLSAGAACMSMLIAAKALGFGAVWLTEWFASNRGVLSTLGLAEHEKLAGFVHIGTEPTPREDRPRPELRQIVTTFA